MKKNWIYIFLSMAIAAMPLTSCDNDDEPQPNEEQKHDPESDEDQVAVTGYDALEWLQGNIAVVDENDEVIRRIYGKPLDASQPTVVSVPVKDLADAEEIFLGWVAPGKEATKVEGGYDYNLTDAEGNAQGSVSFRAVEGETGVIARMSVAEGTALKQVSEVNFIDSELWPENDEYPVYIKNNTYEFETTRFEWSFYTQKNSYILKTTKEKALFYCLRGNNYGEEAILIWLSPDYNIKNTNVPAHAYVQCNATKYLPSVVEAEKVLELFNEMDEKEWANILLRMDKKGGQWSSQLGWHTTGNDEFLLNSVTDKGFWGEYIKCLDLDSHPGEICDVQVSMFDFK